MDLGRMEGAMRKGIAINNQERAAQVRLLTIGIVAFASGRVRPCPKRCGHA
jgi:hypothetical protein